MKQFTRLYNSLGMLAMLCIASCASDELNDRLLPEGKYPMSFTTAVEGQVPTRATTDNTWNGDEQVALAIGDEIKQYTPDNKGSSASLTSTDPFYWQTANETKIVRAWYCGAEYNAVQPTRLTVKTDQSGEGYKQSDFLYASPQEVTFSDRNDAKLTFKHLPAKVVIHLTNGNGLTTEDVKNATVYLVNQATTSGAIDWKNSTVAQTTPGETEILTNVLAEPAENYQKSVQALVVPQQMQGKKFIKVTIGEDAAARDYYYTAKEETDANLKCGMQYTYNITVTKGEGLVVTTTKPSVSWEDGTASSSDVEEATSFYVTCPSSSEVTDFTISNSTNQDRDKYTVKANTTITISYTTTLKRSCYKLVQGIAKVSTPIYENGTIKITVSDIRGDLVFSFDEYGFVEVGDYYYADGTWSPDYVPGDSPACIGVVFKVGAATGDVASNYGDKLPNGIRGYVVALTDAVEEICTWGQRGINTPLDNVTSKDNADYNGFQNTKTIIKQYGETGGWQHYDAFQAIIDYRDAVVASQSSSDWYLPSLKQLADIYSLYQNRAGHILYDRLQSTSSDHLFKEVFEGTYEPGGYWTSTERHESDAWYVRFTDGARTAFSKGQSYARNCYVRAILTF